LGPRRGRVPSGRPASPSVARERRFRSDLRRMLAARARGAAPAHRSHFGAGDSRLRLCARLRMVGARAAFGAPADVDEHAWPLGAPRYLTKNIRAAWQSARNTKRLHLHVVALDGTSSLPRRHCFVPMPHCEVCGGAASIRAARSTHNLTEWVDPLTGVIPAVSAESPRETGLELPIVVTAAPPHLVSEDGTVRRLPIGWGKGLSPADAVLSAVGEAIERYAASLPDRSKMIEGRAADLDGPHLDPRRFALYSPEQYARPGFRSDRTTRAGTIRGCEAARSARASRCGFTLLSSISRWYYDDTSSSFKVRRMVLLPRPQSMTRRGEQPWNSLSATRSCVRG